MMVFDNMTDAFSEENAVLTKILEVFLIDLILIIKDKGHIIYVFVNIHPHNGEEKIKIKIFS